MPTISKFYGIAIRMFFNDHAPPHFHARCEEYEATIAIDALEILEGHLPRRALNLVEEWAMYIKRICSRTGDFAGSMLNRAKIEPLV